MTVVLNSPAGSRAIRPRTAAVLAWLACGLALLLLLAAGLVLLWASPDGPLPEGDRSRLDQAINLVSLLGPPLLGGLLASRRPSNPYGWLWVAYGLGWAVVGFTNAYVTYVTASGTEVLGWAGLIAWVNGFTFVSLLGLTALILLLFPDGRPPSRRWRWLVWAIGVLVVVATIASALLPAGEDDPIQNPLAAEGSIKAVADAVANVGVTALFLAILVAAGSLLWRFRRARGLERQQLKWLAYGGAFLAAYVALDLVSLTPAGLVDALIEALTFGALYVGVGMAVLRYRLYDIDRLINRTLVYGLLTALLGLVYAGAVLVLGQLFGVGRDPPSWAVAGATLAVAALFQPARRRIQAIVDRRFNRRRYDAARTVERFSARLRDEVDLNTLSAELLTVVNQTMQPTQSSLWLRPSAELPASGGGRGG
jgi:FtsH-binding integral membrane protein